jgi:HD-like signal output (HDOD) protein
MTIEIPQDEAEKLIKNIMIPPRPQVLVDLSHETRKDDPDFTRIAKLISGDVSLSAAMLKTVNSPLFHLQQKVASVPQAITMLGLTNVMNISTGIILRNTLSKHSVQMERFWESAAQVAMISAAVASTLPDVPREAAYTYGLFQDCGIPVMMQRFENYKDTLRLANSSFDKTFTAVEDERHNTNHVVVGHYLARAWFLPEFICTAILHHHDLSIFDSNPNHVPPEAITLIATSRVAEHISNSYLRLTVDNEWNNIGGSVLQHLGLMGTEFEDLKEQIHRTIEASH